MLREPSEETSIARKDFFTASFLIFNALLWYYMSKNAVIDSLLSILNVTYTQNIIILTACYAAIIVSGIVGSILSSKISRLKFLYFWMILGAVSSSLPVLFSGFTVTHALVISILLGASFGLGIPSCFAYFADCTLIENRGKIGGITLLFTNLSAPLFVILCGMFDLKVNSLIFVAWRASGLIAFFFLKPKERIISETKRKTTFISILRSRSFILFFIAWLMFNLIDSFETPILDHIFEDFQYILIAPVIGSFFTLIAGLLCDQVGRKLVVLYGFVSMGIAYAIIGIAPAALFPRYFFLTTESVSWAIFYVTFLLILWGDLSQPGNREKYYVIGVVPSFLTEIVSTLSTSYVLQIPQTSAFSLASFFLFLAVLPLLYAPETLPERKIELRRLRRYVDEAKKLQQKYAEKTARK